MRLHCLTAARARELCSAASARTMAAHPVANMELPSLEGLWMKFGKKVSEVEKFLPLRNMGKLPSFSKVMGEMRVLYRWLDEMEAEVEERERLNRVLKKLQKAAERYQRAGQHLRGNIPPHLQKAAGHCQGAGQHPQGNIPPCLPKKTQRCINDVTVMISDSVALVKTPECAKKTQKQTNAAREIPHITVEERKGVRSINDVTVMISDSVALVKTPECAKKTQKQTSAIKEMALINEEEFTSVPRYMKGRLTCPQINEVVREINKAVVSKYKIYRQPLKTCNLALRRQYIRFWEQETEETKGHFFVVEEDIREFTRLRVDKQFHKMITILRHCHRLRHVQDSKAVRYLLY